MLPRVVVLGGGTGTFTILSGLKHHSIELSAIVSVADDGGSTGILRDELGVLPPGDIRQCLAALSDSDDLLRRLFTYRFHEGSLSGHGFGNIFLSALEKITGDPLTAIREAHRILNVSGRVIPVFACATNLFAELEDGVIIAGEDAIDKPKGARANIRRCFLSPSVPANPEAVEAIESADLVVIGPGDLFTSLVPVLFVDGVADALARTRARCVYVLNLVTKPGQSDGFRASKFCEIVSEAIHPARLDGVIVNTSKPDEEIVVRYQSSGEQLVPDDLVDGDVRIFRAPLLCDEIAQPVAGDRLSRSFLRHDPMKLAEAVLEFIHS